MGNFGAGAAVDDLGCGEFGARDSATPPWFWNDTEFERLPRPRNGAFYRDRQLAITHKFNGTKPSHRPGGTKEISRW